ncbi:MAG: amidase [Deinococcota bacterium]
MAEPLIERNISEWQDMMGRGEVSAAELTEMFLQRISDVDPKINAVAEVNPDALDDAAKLDDERAKTGPRSPLHGMPILVKDNLDSSGKMQTTAGSLALEGHIAKEDAHTLKLLRDAGAILLGKANLSEWAYFRSTRGCSGWSSRGGQVRNPYALDRNPCGSSSGSGAGMAAYLAAATVGTETDGSIVCPSSMNGIVGIRPTLGLVSRSGIVPISHSQDTAGPMTHTVSDAALMLTAMTGADASDPITKDAKPVDYQPFLKKDGLKGMRLGVARDYFGKHEGSDTVIEPLLPLLEDLGATLIDPVELTSLGLFGDAEFEVLLYEFKHDLNAYLASHDAQVKSLEEVIAFNKTNAGRVMPYFRQELMEMSQAKGDLSEETYLNARAECLKLSRDEGIDKTMREHQLDAIICPTQSPAWMIDPICGDKVIGGCASPASMAGYPHITVPAGYVYGLPVGLSFFGAAHSEGTLIQCAYAFEQAANVRKPPTFAAHAAID